VFPATRVRKERGGKVIKRAFGPIFVGGKKEEGRITLSQEKKKGERSVERRSCQSRVVEVKRGKNFLERKERLKTWTHSLPRGKTKVQILSQKVEGGRGKKTEVRGRYKRA